MVIIAFQNVFNLEIHHNSVFYFLKKIILNINVLKQSENNKK
jgi:hypothetical protein